MRTAEQSRADYIEKMGVEVGSTYSALWQEVAWIHKKWAQYAAWFGTSPERIELMNRVAPSMFRTVQDALWADVLLHLARLTDPPKSAGKRNLSIQHLANLVEHSLDGDRLNSLAEAALAATNFARDWRNRKLAHRDLELALGQQAKPLSSASRVAVNSALASLAEFINAISQHYLNSTTMFELGPGGEHATELLYAVRDGLRYKEDRIAKLKKGELTYPDLKDEPL